MDNVILRKTLSLIWKLLVLYSVYILLRGHNEPGGGFIGGLLLALGIIIKGYIQQGGPKEGGLVIKYATYLSWLLFVFAAVILLPILAGQDLFTGLWTKIWLPIAGKFSSVLVFDVAVYFVVAMSAVYAHRALSASGKGGAT